MAHDHHHSVQHPSGGPAESAKYIPTRQEPDISSAFSNSVRLDEDWTTVSDVAERRRIQNKVARRNYHNKLKARPVDVKKIIEFPKPEDWLVEDMFFKLMQKRGWLNLPVRAQRQMLAYPSAKKWTFITAELRVIPGVSTRSSRRISKSYSWRRQQAVEGSGKDAHDKHLITAKPVRSARHQISNFIASTYSESSLAEQEFKHREVHLITPQLNFSKHEENDEPSSQEESNADEGDFRVGDLEQLLHFARFIDLPKRHLRSLIVPDGFLHCVYESVHEFLDLVLSDRRSNSVPHGLLHEIANGRDITSDLNLQVCLMAAELKAECTRTSQMDASIFLETYSQYISVVAIDQVKDASSIPSQKALGTMERNPQAKIPHEDVLEQVVADALPSVRYVDLVPHRIFLTSSSAFASFIEALRGLAYPTFFSEAMRSVKATVRSAEESEDKLLASEGRHMLAILLEMESCLRQSNTPVSFFMNSSKKRVTALDRMKLSIEASTAAEWDWWPLQPPSRPGRHDRAELSWQCSCGTERRELTFYYYASELRRIFNDFPLSTGGRSGPIDRPAKSLSNASSQGGRSTQSANSFSAKPSGRQSGSSSSSTSNSAITPPDSVVNFSTGPPRYIYVFLLVKASEYTLDTIDVSSMKARDFFQALKTAYNRHRGLWRQAFSVFVYNHCDFIKIIKPEPETFMPGELRFELPSDHDDQYHYRPRPTYSPPITKHMFQHYFYGCYDSGTLSHRLHTYLPLAPACRIRNPAAELLEYLPKRDRPIAATAQSEKVDVCYGIAARECRSFFRVVVYLCLIIAPAFWFIFAWLFAWGDRGDLQDATVPMTLTLAVLSILWGVLYSGRDIRKDYGDGS